MVVLATAVLGVGGLTAEAGAQVAGASPAGARHNLGLEAKSVATGGKSIMTAGGPLPVASAGYTQSISDRRTASSRTNLEIAVHNYAATPDTVRVEWYFIAQPVGSPSTGNREFVLQRESQPLTVGGAKTETQTISSPEVEAIYNRATAITTTPTGYAANGGYNYTSTVSCDELTDRTDRARLDGPVGGRRRHRAGGQGLQPDV